MATALAPAAPGALSLAWAPAEVVTPRPAVAATTPAVVQVSVAVATTAFAAGAVPLAMQCAPLTGPTPPLLVAAAPKGRRHTAGAAAPATVAIAENGLQLLGRCECPWEPCTGCWAVASLLELAAAAAPALVRPAATADAMLSRPALGKTLFGSTVSVPMEFTWH